jgi:hypothetical protein
MSGVIIDPNMKPPESWFCVATRRDLPPWWTPLATQAGVYVALNGAAKDREKMMAGLRNGLSPGAGWKGWIIVAANPTDGHSVRLSGDLVSRAEEFVPMTPRRIPFCGSANEVLDRVRLTAARDKQFARKWAGWRFLAVRHDDAVVVE